jgi:MFS transporter, NNP family, nitrate/nitrite transporter
MERYSNVRGQALLFILFLWFLWFINFSVRTVISPILPIIEDEFMVHHARASSIFIFLSAGYAVGVVVSGLFSGRVGYKKSVVFALILISAVAFLVPLAHNFFLLYFFEFMIGLSVGLYLPAAIPLITERYLEKDWGKAIAIHDTGPAAAILATPFIALFLLHFMAWRWIFVVFACVLLACSVVFSLASTETKISTPPKATFKDVVKTRSLWLMAILWFFAMGANYGIYSIVPLYLTKELHLTVGYANTVLGLSRLGSVGVAVASGFLIDRFNLRKLMFLVMIVTGMLAILVGLASVKYVGLVLFLEASFVTGFFPMGLVAIAKTFNREMRSLATGIVLAVSNILGCGITPYLLGISGDVYSFRLGITILGIFVALASTLAFRLKELE